MKKNLSLMLLICFHFITAQVPCENGFAGIFPCNGYDFISQVPLSEMNSVKANDSWGWTDPQDGKEYAIVCLNEATAFIDISDHENPVYLGQLPGESEEHTTWRDAKTYNNHVFIVSEDTDHGMQIFDLTKLRDVTNPPVIFSKDAYYSDFGNAHNIAINTDTGFAYILGTDTFNGGPHFVNIQDPVNPVAAGGYEIDGYCHDALIVTYNGPDSDYTGREILFGSNETEVVIEDVTDKTNVVTIATIDYSNLSYTHQGWLTEDQRYFLLGDEIDEIDFGFNSRTIIFDFEDLDNPQFKFEYSGPTGATDHNGYVKGNKFYLANNAAGLRVIDISDIENDVMEEEGFFDSFPDNDLAGFNGSWNIYPYFESGYIVVSDRAQGFILVKSSEEETTGVDDIVFKSFILFPNPTENKITISSNTETIKSIVITDFSGKIVDIKKELNIPQVVIDTSGLANGMYFVTINNSISRKLLKQ